MDLHSIAQDVAELPAEDGFRRYEPVARFANFVPTPDERSKLFAGGALIVVQIDTDGRFVGVAVSDKPRDFRIARHGDGQ